MNVRNDQSEIQTEYLGKNVSQQRVEHSRQVKSPKLNSFALSNRLPGLQK
jgi:hypothetical protein